MSIVLYLPSFSLMKRLRVSLVFSILDFLVGSDNVIIVDLDFGISICIYILIIEMCGFC